MPQVCIGDIAILQKKKIIYLKLNWACCTLSDNSTPNTFPLLFGWREVGLRGRNDKAYSKQSR